MARRAFTVWCAEHGDTMEHDPEANGWRCRNGWCRAALPDEAVFRLVTSFGPDADPVPLVVT